MNNPFKDLEYLYDMVPYEQVIIACTDKNDQECAISIVMEHNYWDRLPNGKLEIQTDPVNIYLNVAFQQYGENQFFQTIETMEEWKEFAGGYTIREVLHPAPILEEEY